MQVCRCSQHLFNVHTSTCMVLTTPVDMHAYSPQKMHMHSCMCAFATVQNLLCHGRYCELIFSLAPALCKLSFATHPVSTKSVVDVVRSKNPSKSILAHDVVASALSHKHHLIIRVGAGLIQFVYGSHSKRGPGAHWLQRSNYSINKNLVALLEALFVFIFLRFEISPGVLTYLCFSC